MSDPRTDLPSASATNFEQRVRETLMTYLGRQGDPMDRGLTLRDLLESGIIKIKDGYTLRPGGPRLPLLPGDALPKPGEELDLTPPPQPTGFSVASAISHVFIEHDAPLYTQGGGHLRTRVYGITYTSGPLPVFADAVEITQFTGTAHAHPSNPATTWRLWIKWETRAGVLSSTPAGGVNGLEVTTAQDVALLLHALTNQITESQLYSSLSARIDLIDGPVGSAGTVNARIQEEVTNRTQAILAEAAARLLADQGLQEQIDLLEGFTGGDFSAVFDALNQEIAARIAGDLAEASARALAVSELQAVVFQEETTRASADAALASQVFIVAAATNGNLAALKTEQDARTSMDAATASQVTTLGASVGGALSGIVTEQQVRTTEDSALAGRLDAMVASTGANSAAIRLEQDARADADSSLSGQTLMLTATTGTTSAALLTEQQVRADADASQAGQVSALLASTSDIRAGLFTEQQVRATHDSAQAASLAGMAVAVGDAGAGILNEQQVRATSDSALSLRTDSLASVVGSTSAALVSEASTRASGDTAVAEQITTLQASSGSNTAAINQEVSVRASETGDLYAKYTVKVDVNGYVSGYGLASTSNGATPFSDFAVRADRFYIASPSGPGITPAMPFIVHTTSGTWGAAGVYMRDAFIQNGTITNAKIANLAVDNAKIADVSAAKITAGSIGVGQHIQSTSYTAGSAGWRINADGTAEFNNVTARGSVFATNGQFLGTLLGGSATTYTSGLGLFSGWTSGTTDANYRWRVGSPTGARIQWTGSAIEVYNASNQLTLASGNLNYSFITGDKPPADATRGADGSNLAVGIGANLLPNSDLTLSITPWAIGYNQSGVADIIVERNLAGDDWRPVGGNTAGIRRTGTPTGVWDLLNSTLIPVQQGVRYEASGRIASHRCNAAICISFYNTSGALLTHHESTYTKVNGGRSISNWTHAVLFAVAPDHAVTAAVRVRCQATGETNPYAWITQGMFCVAGVGQTEPSRWTSSNFAELISSANISTYIAGAAIGTAQIANAAIGTAQIANAAVDNAKIANLAVDSAKIASAAITNAKIADAAITTAKINDLAVDTLKIAGNAVTATASAYTDGGVNVPLQGSTFAVAAQVTLTTSGQPILVTFSSSVHDGEFGYTVRLRDSDNIIHFQDTFSSPNTGYEQPTVSPLAFVRRIDKTAGTRTYYIEVGDRAPNRATSLRRRSLALLEVKR